MDWCLKQKSRIVHNTETIVKDLLFQPSRDISLKSISMNHFQIHNLLFILVYGVVRALDILFLALFINVPYGYLAYATIVRYAGCLGTNTEQKIVDNEFFGEQILVKYNMLEDVDNESLKI